MKRTAFLSTVALVATVALTFAAKTPEGGPPAEPAHAAPGLEDVDLADFDWLAGSWSGAMFGLSAEEHWSTPKAGGMLGSFRLLGEVPSKTIYEFLLLEEDAAGIHLRFQHVGPGYKVWEQDGPLEFKLVSAEGRVYTFESPDPAQSPTRLTYALPDPGRLIVTVETVREGQVKESFDVVYTRGD